MPVDLVLQTRHVVGRLVGIVHRQLVIAVEHGLLIRHALHGVAEHVLRLVELRLLRKVAHAHAIRGPGLTLMLRLHARHDLQECRLTRAVHAHHADLRIGQEGERDVVQHLLSAGVGFGKLLHHVDVLRRGHGVSFFEGVARFARMSAWPRDDGGAEAMRRRRNQAAYVADWGRRLKAPDLVRGRSSKHVGYSGSTERYIGCWRLLWN